MVYNGGGIRLPACVNYIKCHASVFKRHILGLAAYGMIFETELIASYNPHLQSRKIQIALKAPWDAEVELADKAKRNGMWHIT